MAKKYNRYVDYLIIAIVSLIPFIWSRGGYIILGHDAGTPISPAAHFLDRLYTWTQRYGLGADQSFAIPGFFIHGMEFFFSLLNLPLWLNQSIIFTLFFAMIGGAMYYCARTLFPDRRYVPLFAAVFYQVNHFTLQAWFIAERTKFSTYIDLPIIIACIYQITHNLRRPFRLGLITGIIMTFMNGGGFIPVFGAILICAPLYMLLLIIESRAKIELMRKYLIYIASTGGSFVLFNLYWLIPYVSYVKNSFASEVSRSGGIDGVLNWTTEISRNTSISNLFRLQGIQEWYANPYHTYAPTFLENKGLIAISLLLPILAYGSMLVRRGTYSRTILHLGIISLVSIAFMAGSHPPFGFIYVAFLRNIPGFIAFRTPFYKFAPGLWFSYALLIGYTLNHLIERTPGSIRSRSGPIKVLLAVAIIAYSFPILGTRFFTYFTDRSTHVKVPQYVVDYAHYANSSQFKYHRMLVLPPQPEATYAEQTDWGFWSIATVNSLTDIRSYVSNNLTNTPEENLIIADLYHSIVDNDPAWVEKARFLGIDGILLREDILPYKIRQRRMDAQTYKNILSTTSSVHQDRTYGKWSVYALTTPISKIQTISGYYALYDYQKLLNATIYDLPMQVASAAAFIRNPKQSYDRLKIADIVIPNCEHCAQISEPLIKESREVSTLPGSPLYRFKLRSEKDARDHLHTSEDLMTYQAAITIRRLFEIEKLYNASLNYGVRAEAWDQYSSDLELLTQYMNTYDAKTPILDEKNKVLIQVKDSLSLQATELKDIISRVVDTGEGRAFLHVYDRIPQLIKHLGTKTTTSPGPLIKKYLAMMPADGLYDVYVKNDSINVSSSAYQPIQTNIDSTTHTSNIIQNSDWTHIAQQSLRKGSHLITITENALDDIINYDLLARTPNIEVESDNSLILKFTGDNQCVEIPLGYLSGEKYILNYNIQSLKDPLSIQTFVTSENKNIPLLPYLGSQYSIPSKEPLHVTNDIPTALDNSNYVYKICNVYNPEQIYDLRVTGLKMSGISKPKVVLVRQNPSYIGQNLIPITERKYDNTHYTAQASFSTPNIVTLSERYDPQWILKTSNGKALQPFKINGYANAWYVPNNTGTINIEFAAQRQYIIGVVASIVSLVIVITILVLCR